MSWQRLLSAVMGNNELIDSNRATRFSESELQDAIEKVVDEIDPRIRALSSYRKKLKSCVERALTHCAELVTLVPPGVEVSSKSWGKDPLVRAFFSGVNDLRQVFSNNREIQDYFAQHTNAEHCYALLSLDYRERTVLGIELHGDVIKRDVKQTAVSFSIQRIVKPSASEDELREHLEQSAFENLISYVLERISELLARRHLLEEQRKLQTIQLKISQLRNKDIDSLISPENQSSANLATLREQGAHAETEHEQVNIRLDTLEDYINRITEVLDNPQAYFKVSRINMHLSQMNIKLNKPSTDTDHTLELCEASLGEHLKRILMIARFPRSNLLPRHDFLD